MRVRVSKSPWGKDWEDVGFYTTKEEAKRVAEQWRKKGYNARVLKVKNPIRGRYGYLRWRVRATKMPVR